MLIELPVGWVILLNVAGWPAIQLGLASLFLKMPERWFHGPVVPGDESLYDRWFAVRAWKDRLPDGARWLGGTFTKGSLPRSDPDYLQRFIAETWRGELCHWSALAFTPLFLLWNPWWASLIMIAYAILANVPCILAQRYNRLRFARVAARRRISH